MYDILSGLKIIEVSSFVASPTAGLYCAQFGADVVRIDHTAGGLDYDRYMMTPEGRSLSWENLNRAKKSVALNLQSPQGRELCVELDYLFSVPCIPLAIRPSTLRNNFLFLCAVYSLYSLCTSLWPFTSTT